MRPIDTKHFTVGPRLTLTFALLVAVILGGNALLIWQFQIAKVQTDHLSDVSQKLISVLRLQASVLSFHQRLGELAESKNARLLRTESEFLQDALFKQLQQTRSVLTHPSDGTRVEPSFSAALEAIELSVSTQLHALNALATSGDWDAVGARMADKQPLESKASALVESVDQEFTSEHSRSESSIRSVRTRILVLVPAIAISTFCIATFFVWTIVGRIVELRLEARVNERTRITQDLHDTFLQTVQGSKLIVDDALKKSDDHDRVLAAMEQVSIWLAQASQEGRAALNSIRTSTIETNNLAAALRRALEECRQDPMETSFSVSGEAKDMQPIVRDEIYRVAYEAIRNACTHSMCKQLSVDLKYSTDLKLRVSDDGIGMDPVVADRGKDGHFGFPGMRDRVARIGGRITVVSSPGSGTEVIVVVPGRIVFRKVKQRQR
jgi:signal transduction histidine kinase